MNDNGAIVGTATYSDGTTHGVMLLPIQIVREYPPGSGNFQPIIDNGLDDKAQLPIYTTENGSGRAMSWSNSYTFTAQLSANLNSSSTASMVVAFQNSSGSFNGTVTETSAGSGIFQDSANTITITLSPTTQTTSSSTLDTLNVTVTDSTLGLSGTGFTLQETTTSSNSFTAVTAQTVVTLSGTLSTTAVNTIQLFLEETGGSQDFVTTLTETAVNSRVFQDNLGTTLTMNGYTSGTSMNVAISSTSTGRLPVALFTATLTETSSSSLQFVNYLVTIGDVTPSTPETNGQCVFYVQFPGSAATSITLASGSNSVTTTASPVTGQPNLLRTGKLVLLTPNDPFTATDITTLTVSPPSGGGNPTVSLQMYGQTVVDPGSAYLAYVGECASDSHFALPARHLSDIQSILTSGLATSPGYPGSPGLGWGCSVPDQVLTRASAQAAIPTHNLWYSYSHGLTTVPDAPPFVSFQVWPGSSLHNPFGYGQAQISPADVKNANTQTVNGKTSFIQEYQLVFINGCFSADVSNTASQAGAFITDFNTDSYVGWSYDQRPAGAATAAEIFFQALVGKSTPVSNGVNAVNAHALNYPNEFVLPDYGVNGGKVPESFVALIGSDVVIQK